MKWLLVAVLSFGQGVVKQETGLYFADLKVCGEQARRLEIGVHKAVRHVEPYAKTAFFCVPVAR